MQLVEQFIKLTIYFNYLIYQCDYFFELMIFAIYYQIILIVLILINYYIFEMIQVILLYFINYLEMLINNFF